MGCLRINRTCVPAGFAVATTAGVLGHAWLAATPWSRLVGLLGTADLGPSEVVVLRPCSAVHGIGLRVRIGVAFIDGQGVVLRVVDPLPWRGARQRGAAAVVEAASGVLCDLRAGDRVRLTGASLFPHGGHFPAHRGGSTRGRRALSGQRGHTAPANDRRM